MSRAPYHPTILVLSEISIPISITSIVTGSLALYYASPNIDWPVSSGIGITVGVIGLVAAIMGLIVSTKFDNPNYSDKTFNCLNGVLYGFSIATWINGLLDIIWSSMILYDCTMNEDDDDEAYCKNNYEGTLTMAATNVCLGTVLFMLNISQMIMYNLNYKFMKNSDPEQVHLQ